MTEMSRDPSPDIEAPIHAPRRFGVEVLIGDRDRRLSIGESAVSCALSVGDIGGINPPSA
jgi:hypothetical protein